jgi:hypothetical protein
MGDQAASLIIILHHLQIPNEIPPSDVNLLYRFSVFSQWQKLSADEGKTFEQNVSIAFGNEEPILHSATVFKITGQVHRIVTNFNRIPTLRPGELTLSLSIRTQGDSEWPKPIATYPITISQVPKVPVN